jgi:transcriptional regulator with XRE-family HTH domain
MQCSFLKQEILVAKAATPQLKKRPRVFVPAPMERISPSEEHDVPEFRTRLAKVLEARDWSQRKLARFLNRDPRQINLTIISKYKPDLEMLVGIANGLDISIDWLLGVGRKPTLDDPRSPSTLQFKLNKDDSLAFSLPKLWVESVMGTDVTDLELSTAESNDMAPTIMQNDIIFIRHVGFTKKSGIFKLKAGGTEILRRLKYNAVTGQVTVMADADPESATSIDEKKLTVIGPVTKLGHKFYTL